jgi:L-iditol 2-dehydrogenase
MVDVGDLRAEVAALAEPMSCAINNLSRVPEGALGSVVIIGLGPLGVLHAIAARARGARCIVGVDPSTRRQAMASRFGFDAVCSPQDVRGPIDRWTGGEGFDLVVATAPAPAAQAGAIDLACKGGYVSLFGSLPVGEEMLTISSRTIHYGELNVYGSSDSTVAHVKEAVAVLRSHEAKVRPMVTHILPLDEFDEAMRLMASGEGLKVALRPSL